MLIFDLSTDIWVEELEVQHSAASQGWVLLGLFLFSKDSGVHMTELHGLVIMTESLSRAETRRKSDQDIECDVAVQSSISEAPNRGRHKVAAPCPITKLIYNEGDAICFRTGLAIVRC